MTTATMVTGSPEQERDENGRWASGGASGGLPKKDGHMSKVGGSFEKGNDHQSSLHWAHTKAAEHNKPVYVQPNPKHVPGKPGEQAYKLSPKPPKSGDYHAVHPDGRITYHQAPIKAKGVHGRAMLSRSVETSADGKAPHAVRLWRAGWNETDKGPLNFTPKSAETVMARHKARGNPLVFDYEHESTLPLEKRGGAPMKGVASAPSAALEVRPDAEGHPELWAVDVRWTPEAQRQIETGERRQISPISNYDLDTKEITEIVNVALCREGATHHGTILASAERGTTGMDEIIQKIVEALQDGDYETAESLVQQCEAMGEGDEDMARYAKTARAMCSAGKAMAAKFAAPPPPPKGDAAPDSTKPGASARMAASREASGAYSRQFADMEARTRAAEQRAFGAEREAKVGRVEGMIAANRDMFDAIDEREHLRSADPDATRRHIASITRKRNEGTLEASRPKPGGGEVKPPKDGNKDDSFGLSAAEIEIAGREGISLKDFADAKGRQANSKRRAGAGSN